MDMMRYDEFKELNDKEKKEYLIKNGPEFKSINELLPDEINGLEEFDALLTDEEKVETILSYGYKGGFLYDKYTNLFSQTQKMNVFRNYLSGHDILEKNENTLSNQEKVAVIKHLGSQGMEWFKKYINLFTNQEKANIIKGYGVDGVLLFEQYIELFNDEEIVSSIKKHPYNFMRLFEEKIDLFTAEEKKNIIIGYGSIAGAELFEKNIELFSEEERLKMLDDMIENFYAFKAAQILENRMEYYTDEQKKHLIKNLKIAGKRIFETTLDIFTDEEKFEMINIYGENGYELFKTLSGNFRDEQVVEYFTNLFSNNGRGSSENNKDRIYEILHSFSNRLKREEIEKLLLLLYPDGRAVEFYNKINLLPNRIILEKFPLDQIEKFDKKVWMLLATQDLYYENDQTKAAFVEAALSLGIFEKDKEVKNRIAFLGMLAKSLPKTYEFTGVLDDLENMKSKFEIISQKTVKEEYEISWVKFFNKNSSQNIKLFENSDDMHTAYYKLLEIYGETISGTRFNQILSANYCTQKYTDAMKMLMDSAYDKIEIKGYKVYYKHDFNKLYKENKVKAIRLEKELRKFYWRKDRNDMMTPIKLHRIFDGMDMKYRPGFYEFFRNNLYTILENQDKQKMLSKIQRNWEKIVETNLGQKITFNKCEKYFLENAYKDVVTEDDKEIAKLSIQSGYSQEQYGIVRKIYEEQKKRKRSSIPLIEEKEGKNGYRYKVLRLDDPTTIFVGELTKCCQAINRLGESCMIHSATSENGRIIVVLDETEKVLSQSWLWRNQNVLCFDNVEAIRKDKNNRKVVGTEILNTVKRAAQKFLEVDQEKMAEWELKEKENLNKKLQNKEITKDEYNEKLKQVIEQVEKQTLSKITVGQGYTDIALSGLEIDKENAFPLGDVAYTADSRMQFILASKSDKILPKDSRQQMVALYEDGDEYKKLIEVDTSEMQNSINQWFWPEDGAYVDYETLEEVIREDVNDTPENIHIINFRKEIYMDDVDFEIEEENCCKKKGLKELQEEKQELEEKLAEAQKLKAEYIELDEKQNRTK